MGQYYRKSPGTVVEAAQWWPVKQVDGVCNELDCDYTYAHVHLVPGTAMLLMAGDWIVTDVYGKRLTYKNKQFHSLFKLVQEPTEFIPILDKMLYAGFPVDYTRDLAMHPFIGDPTYIGEEPGAHGAELCEGCGEHFSWHKKE